MSSRVADAAGTGLVRERNEDSACVGHWLCAVADGMGGHAAGDVASATVIDAIRRFDAAAEDPKQITAVLGNAINAIREANRRLTVTAQADPSLASMGSTMTAMAWSERSMVVAHIGDSRAYRLRAGVLKQLTEDHVMSNLVASPMPAEIGEYLVRFLARQPPLGPVRPVRPLNCADFLSLTTTLGDFLSVATIPLTVLSAL